MCFLPFSAGMALAMSPSTASIMSAVPTRRAGMGSAMNDATRELGAALGVAILGSIAASRYAAQITPSVQGLGPADQAAADGSISGALDVAAGLGTAAGDALTDAAQQAFLSGLHLAVLAAAGLALLSAGLVLRYLPHSSAAPAPSTARWSRSRTPPSSGWAARSRCSPTTSRRRGHRPRAGRARVACGAMPIHLRAEPGDYAPSVLCPGDPRRAAYIAETFFDPGARLVNEERGMLGFTGTFEGRPISVQSTGMGCPSAGIVFEELVHARRHPAGARRDVRRVRRRRCAWPTR